VRESVFGGMIPRQGWFASQAILKKESESLPKEVTAETKIPERKKGRPRTAGDAMNWMRRLLVKASESAWLREYAPRLGFVRGAALRFLPGENVDDALAAARRLAADQIATLLTHLGENVGDRDEAESVTGQYLDLLDRIDRAGLPSEISVKLTQLGLDLDETFCFANLLRLVEYASTRGVQQSRLGRTVWIDMEQSAYLDRTLDLHHRARRAHPNVGVCVQAYLRRSQNDVGSLIAMGASVRLVKGAYSEPAGIAFEEKKDVDENYFRLAQLLLGPEAQRRGVRVALATHDRALIARVIAWAAAQGIGRDRLEFAMLYGIERSEQLRLAREGYRSDVLVSYGSFWFPWFMRRLAERPANLFFLIRNLFSS
jgi:proline dehydrogenase